MNTWFLVIYIYAGILAKGDSVALQAIPMANEAACQSAAKNAEGLVKGSAKQFRYVCINTGAKP